jgi:SAM-dependent methyltransferase
MSQDPKQLEAIYNARFAGRGAYRDRVWRVLVEEFFQRYVASDASVLDLGCGHGEFINHVAARAKYGMDLNPASARLLAPEVRFLQADCAAPWPLADGSLDVVFTSNFLEHLPGKRSLAAAFEQAWRCLRPGGSFVAMGPNIRCVHGAYWDFWDHHIPLTELSMSEGLRQHGFDIEVCRRRFLPYTMSDGREYPMALLRAYLALPVLWRLLGRQFLVVAVRRPG